MIELREGDKIKHFPKEIFKNTKESAEEHSFLLDKLLNIESTSIEHHLLDQYAHFRSPKSSDKKKLETQPWVGLCPQVLQTPYSEIYEAFKILESFNINSVVDFGAGYGRVAYLTKAYFPRSSFTGYEIIKERVGEANKAFRKNNMLNCHVFEKDLLEDDFIIPDADLYFLYDFSEAKDLIVFFKKFVSFFENKKSFLILRGKGARSLIQYDYPGIWRPYGVIHRENWSIYSSFFDLDQINY